MPNDPGFVGFHLMAQALNFGVPRFTNVAPIRFFWRRMRLWPDLGELVIRGARDGAFPGRALHHSTYR